MREGHAEGRAGSGDGAAPPAPRELTLRTSPPGRWVPLPTVGVRLLLERREGGGWGEESSSNPAAWLFSPIFRWKKEGERKGKAGQGKQPGCPRGSLEAPERPEEESEGLPPSPRAGAEAGRHLRAAQPAEGLWPGLGAAGTPMQCSATAEPSYSPSKAGVPGGLQAR